MVVLLAEVGIGAADEPPAYQPLSCLFGLSEGERTEASKCDGAAIFVFMVVPP